MMCAHIFFSRPAPADTAEKQRRRGEEEERLLDHREAPPSRPVKRHRRCRYEIVVSRTRPSRPPPVLMVAAALQGLVVADTRKSPEKCPRVVRHMSRSCPRRPQRAPQLCKRCRKLSHDCRTIAPAAEIRPNSAQIARSGPACSGDLGRV